MSNKHFNPWIKEENRKKAEEHYSAMEESYPNSNSYSIANSTVYYNDTIYGSGNNKIIMEQMTTDAAVYKYNTGKLYNDSNGLCVLNFASYKWPGGGYIFGAMAQEEALCHVSNLFNVIGSKDFENYYLSNRNKLDSGEVNSLYENFAIFSPDIIFNDPNDSEKYAHANVLTCPAPNLSNGKFTESEAEDAMKKRIKFVLDIMQRNNQKTIILGAFGCGVFKNDPKKVASIFNMYLTSGFYNFDKIIFAIPYGHNYDAFAEVFNC